MYTSPSNIIDGLILIVKRNLDTINALIREYEPSSLGLSVFKGMRKTLPISSFPSLELEPTSGSMQWLTTSAQTNEYGVAFTLTIMTDNDDMGVEYICALTREFTQLFNMPGNMCFPIPYEKGWNPVDNCLAQNYVQFGSINGVTYNSSKDGTIRVSQWDWNGSVLEGFTQNASDLLNLTDMPQFPHELPPLTQ